MSPGLNISYILFSLIINTLMFVFITLSLNIHYFYLFKHLSRKQHKSTAVLFSP